MEYEKPLQNRTGAAASEPMAMILRIVIGALLGAGLGFAYYKFIGCSSGTCPLTSHPVIASLYGAVIGSLIASSIR